MSKYSSAFDFSANFKVKVAGALDPRVVAASKEDLINKNNWPSDGDTIYVYNGLIVDCGSDGVYRLIDKTKVLAADYSGWEKIGETFIIINEITYQEFIQLKSENKLIPGKKYKIIDYETWIGENQYLNVIETKNVIPIIITAITENSIDEIAETEDSIIRINIFDTYKQPTSTTDSNRGMGEILWMKDKNGNSAPWDFKSIKWKFTSDNLPEGFDINTEYSTFDDNSFNNTILIDELTSPVILKNSYNNIINIKNSSLICIDSADNDIFVENNDDYNQINNINKSIIKLSNDNLNYVKKLSEGLFLETQNQLLDDMLNYNNEIVINEPLTEFVNFNIKGQCSLDFKIGSEIPTIEFSGVKFIKELDLVEDTRYLILFDQKIQNNNKTDIVAIWAAVSNT